MNRQQIEELARKLNTPNAPRVFDDNVVDSTPEPAPAAPAQVLAAKPAPAPTVDQLELDKMSNLDLDKLSTIEKFVLLKILYDRQEERVEAAARGAQ